jgi:hypothetical protein
MKYALFTGLLCIAGVNGARTSFVMPGDGGEPVEHLRRVPEGWSDIGAAPADHKMNFRIAVRSVSPLKLNFDRVITFIFLLWSNHTVLRFLSMGYMLILTGRPLSARAHTHGRIFT